MASGTEGFFGGTGRAASWSAAFGAGDVGEALEDNAAEGGAGFAGVVCGVALLGIGRGFGKGTADAAFESSAIAAAPSTIMLQRSSRAGLTDEGANGVTADLCGESFKSLRFQV